MNTMQLYMIVLFCIMLAFSTREARGQTSKMPPSIEKKCLKENFQLTGLQDIYYIEGMVGLEKS